jgi:hypothetical protein
MRTEIGTYEKDQMQVAEHWSKEFNCNSSEIEEGTL